MLAVTIGTVVAALSLLGNWVRPYWLDEGATLRAARVNGATLLSFLSELDAVHGLYYMAIHAWIEVFGESEFAVRSVSALAAGLAAAGIVVLCAQFQRRSIGIVAALIFALLPRTVQMSAEGRSYALSTACVVWGVVALVRAARTGGWWAWTLYVFTVVLGTYVFLYSVLIVAVHAVYVLCRHRQLRALRAFAISAGIIVALVSPLVQLAYGQKGQIDWIANYEWNPFHSFVISPSFAWNSVWATVAGVLLLGSFVRLARPERRDERMPAFLLVMWIALPTALLAIADATIGSLYVARYLTFTTPAMAILLALAVCSLRSRWGRAIAAITLISVGIYGFVSDRYPDESTTSGYRTIADSVERFSCPGDAFWLQEDGDVENRPRWALYAYPDRFTELTDLAFVRNGLRNGSLRDVTVKPADIASRLDGVDRIWVVTTTDRTPHGNAVQSELTRLGWALGNVYELPVGMMTEYLSAGTVPGECDATPR